MFAEQTHEDCTVLDVAFREDTNRHADLQGFRGSFSFPRPPQTYEDILYIILSQTVVNKLLARVWRKLD